MFSCDFFSIFSQVRGPFWVTKSAGPGAMAPSASLETATALSSRITQTEVGNCLTVELYYGALIHGLSW